MRAWIARSVNGFLCIILFEVTLAFWCVAPFNLLWYNQRRHDLLVPVDQSWNNVFDDVLEWSFRQLWRHFIGGIIGIGGQNCSIYTCKNTDQESRLETLLWGRNIVLIWGITKPFQQNEVPCYACKEFRAPKANVIFKLAYSLNTEQGTSFSGRAWMHIDKIL